MVNCGPSYPCSVIVVVDILEIANGSGSPTGIVTVYHNKLGIRHTFLIHLANFLRPYSNDQYAIFSFVDLNKQCSAHTLS